MAAVGGSIEAVSIDGREFGVAADADVSRKLGGYENETQANGNRTGRQIKTAVVGMISGLQLSIDDARDDQRYLQDIADAAEFVSCTVTYASGETWEADAQIEGEMTFSNQNSTASIDLAAPGGWTKQ